MPALRTVRTAAALSILATSCLGILPGVAGGVSSATTTLVPPFNHTKLYDRNSSMVSGCSSVQTPVPPHFSHRSSRLVLSVLGDSPACLNRIGSRYSNDAQPYWSLGPFVVFTAPTGVRTIAINISFTWLERLNLTAPTCVNHATSPRFVCEVRSEAGILGSLGLTKSNGRPIPHLVVNSSWSIRQKAVTDWAFRCPLTVNSSCHITSTTHLNRTFSGSIQSTGVFTGYFNSSLRYEVGAYFDVWGWTESYHTAGGSMSGGTASALAAIDFKVNSITVT